MPIVPVLVESWSGQVNSGVWLSDRASSRKKLSNAVPNVTCLRSSTYKEIEGFFTGLYMHTTLTAFLTLAHAVTAVMVSFI